MGIGFIEPFNFEKILINVFSGSYTLFIVFGMILIAMMAARWRIPDMVVVSIFVLFMVMIVGTIGTTALYISMGVIFMIVIGLGIHRYFNK